MNPLIERLGWTLLHSLWQGVLALAVLRAALAALHRHSSHVRYLAACGTLVLATLAPWITFFRLDVTQRLSEVAPARVTQPLPVFPRVSPGPEPRAIVDPGAGGPAVSARPSDGNMLGPGRLETALRPAFPWIVGVWITGFVFCSVRLFFGWCRTCALVRGPLPPAPAEVVARFASLLSRLRLRRRVRLGLSCRISAPAVVGWLRPVVLLPMEALAGLSPGQLDALLLHELAHVRRADVLVNLLQAVTEALFFYHPAFHAINRLIREEREHACDDWAVGVTGNAVAYAHALAALASSAAGAPSLALAATGDGKTGGVLVRIRRLLGRPPAHERPFTPLAWVAFTGALLYVFAMLGAPAVAARLLTPEERIELVRETAAIVSAQATPEFPRGAKVEVTGEVRTEDGSPLPPAISLIARTQNRYSGTATELKVVSGQAHGSLPAGEIYLLLYAPGWAPTFAGPIQPRRLDEKLALPELVLRRGFPARLRVLDDRGSPLAGVRLQQPWIRSSSPASNRNLNRPGPDLVTDANGKAVFANVAADTELEITIAHPGFQTAIRRFEGFSPGVLSEFRLTPARLTPGHIIDANTGQPVAGAKVLLAGQQRPDTNAAYSLQNNIEMAVADDTGRFVLDTLNENWTTYVYVSAPGYAPTSLEATIGKPMEVRLDRGIRIAGRIRAGERVSTKGMRVIADYSLQTGPQSAFGHQVEQALDSTQPEPTFSFDHLPRGSDSVSISVANRSIRLSGHTDHVDLVIDLASTTPGPRDTKEGVVALGPVPRRQVILTIRPPANEPAPDGEIEFDYRAQGLNREDNTSRPLPLVPVRNGRIELELAVPNRLEITQARLPGYTPSIRSLEVPEGQTPLTLDLPLVPAGAIRGRLIDAHGRPLPGWFLSCAPDDTSAAQPRVTRGNPFWGEPRTNAAGGFLAGGLPLDRGYVFVAHREFFYATSDLVRLSGREPVQEIEWRLAQPAAFLGRLIGPDGAPVSRAKITLAFESRTGDRFGNGAVILSENDGRFEIPGINPAEAAGYELVVTAAEPWQPLVFRFPRELPATETSLTLRHHATR